MSDHFPNDESRFLQGVVGDVLGGDDGEALYLNSFLVKVIELEAFSGFCGDGVFWGDCLLLT